MKDTGISEYDMLIAASWLAMKVARANREIDPTDCIIMNFIIYEMHVIFGEMMTLNRNIPEVERGRCKIHIARVTPRKTYHVTLRPGKVYGYVGNDLWPEFASPPAEAERMRRLRSLRGRA